MPLSDAKIRNTKPGEKPQKLTDSGGLYLEVRPSGAKLWRYRYRIAGKENIFSIGKYPDIGLSEAREQHRKARSLVVQGTHPAHHRQAERLVAFAENENTFEAVAREWIAKKGINWSPYYRSQIENFLTADMFPDLGKRPIRSVTAAHLLKILHRVEDRGASSVALLLRQWSSAIFRYAVATLRADSDPAAALIGAIHRPKVKHHKPLSRQDIADLAKAIDEFGGYRTTVIAIHLMLLTFVRTGELRKAEWSEFDLERAEWVIPEGRMKMDELHIVPLSRQAVELIQELRSYTGGRVQLFPNYRNPQVCMCSTTINRALERMGFNGKNSIGFSAHGFRATASTFLNELGYRADVIERQLAHAERNKVRASYNQAEYMDERRKMMQDWADMIDTMMKKSKSNITGPN
ncbi:phage integrase central domain-containing protein [uncultured Tolumonas sp.]|uniref:tyrosine-type recombinase/integrase n=1 Tax=uncultured Tolumonas sp. TaxID=263765 RepID=UPI0029316337|nr:integrase arm-type DNA-binding domain-containing protein [uncultured Tolumonas sp.]